MTETNAVPTYPLGEHHARRLQAASGRHLSEITPAAAAAGGLAPQDLQISGETLRQQAAIARRAGYIQLAENLTRAAELTAVPNEELLEMYQALRPGRSTYGELQALAARLEEVYAAPENAAFVRKAAAVYRQRRLLKRSPGGKDGG